MLFKFVVCLETVSRKRTRTCKSAAKYPSKPHTKDVLLIPNARLLTQEAVLMILLQMLQQVVSRKVTLVTEFTHRVNPHLTRDLHPVR